MEKEKFWKRRDLSITLGTFSFDANNDHVVSSTFTYSFMNQSSECLLSREVTVISNDTGWFDLNLRYKIEK